MEKDLYKVLEIPNTASEADIKRAYKKLALRWHPDKNPERKEEAEQRFKEITAAYEILSDLEKRQQYNRYGLAGTNTRVHDFSSADHLFRDLFQDIFDENDPFDRELMSMFSACINNLHSGSKSAAPRPPSRVLEKYTVEESPYLARLCVDYKRETWVYIEGGKIIIHKRTEKAGRVIETVEDEFGAITSKTVNGTPVSVHTPDTDKFVVKRCCLILILVLGLVIIAVIVTVSVEESENNQPHNSTGN